MDKVHFISSFNQRDIVPPDGGGSRVQSRDIHHIKTDDLIIDNHSAKITKTPLNVSSNISFEQSSHQENSRYHDPSIKTAPLLVAQNTGSTVSNYKALYLTDTPSSIIGDFMPINSRSGSRSNMDDGQPGQSTDTSPSGHIVTKNRNPYMFEPDTSEGEGTPQTSFDDFIKAQRGICGPSHRTTMDNYIRSAVGHKPLAIATDRSRERSHQALPQHIGSLVSPIESPPDQGSLEYPLGTKNPSWPSIEYGSEKSPKLECHQVDQRSMENMNRGRKITRDHCSPSRVRQTPNETSQWTSSPSPSRSTRHSRSKNTYLDPFEYGKEYSHASTTGLDSLFERDENIFSHGHHNQSSQSGLPKVRSRSPMKKMFGERGWLGKSPAEVIMTQVPPEKKDESPKHPKKSSVMEKIKSKIEEMAEKADINIKSDLEKQKMTRLPISLVPPQQAKIYMELELMLVHTANSFLMSQFCQGRTSLDTIKKTVNNWKSRGRPSVIEFMYDQSTQRDLIAANQQNFRFHGKVAGDDMRVGSMLYNWKQVAHIMAIRTFCDADTIIQKLIFDIQQILELIGAREAILVRLQQIRSIVNKWIRDARDFESIKPQNGQEINWDISEHANAEFQASRDPYGGLKLVPESYEG